MTESWHIAILFLNLLLSMAVFLWEKKGYCYTWICHAAGEHWAESDLRLEMGKMSSWSTFPDLFLQVYEQNKNKAKQNELKMFSQKWQIKEPFLWMLHKLNMNKMNPTSGPFFFFISLKNRYNNAVSAHKNQARKIKSRVPQVLLFVSFWNGKRLNQIKSECPPA